MLPQVTFESLPSRAFLWPLETGENEEEDKTKSLSVNPFRSWGFPWFRQKGATWGDLERKGESLLPPLHCLTQVGELHCDPTTHYTNNNYSPPLQRARRGPLVLTQLQWIACARCAWFSKQCWSLSYAGVRPATACRRGGGSTQPMQWILLLSGATHTNALCGLLLALFQAPTPQQCTWEGNFTCCGCFTTFYSLAVVLQTVVGEQWVESRH